MRRTLWSAAWAAPQELAGGSSACFGDYYVPYPKESLLSNTNGGLTDAQAETMYNAMLENSTWMMYCGMTTNDFYKVNGAGVGFYTILSAAMQAMGASILYETATKGLVVDPVSRTVCGVRAVAADGKTLYCKANRGVLLATGSVNGSDTLLHDLYIPKGTDVVNVSSPYHTGDGLMMGLSAGAALHNANPHSIEISYLALKKVSEELGTGMLTGPVGEKRGARIFVNGAGKRFMNEEEYLVHSKNLYKWLAFPGNAETGYLGWTNQPMYLIFDSQLFGSEAVGGFLADYGWAYSKGIYTWSADNQAELDKGWLVQGDTLEELAASLAAQSGRAPLDKGPFYAAELSMSVMYTIGGLKSSPVGETLDWAGDPISGLCHAGDVGQLCEIGPQGACGCSAMGTLAVRAMCVGEAHTIPGEAGTVVAASTAEQQQFTAHGYFDPNAVPASSEATADSVAAASDAVYKDGTYTGVGNSAIGGEIQVTVEVTGDKIASVTVNSHNETLDIGGKTLETLTEQAVAAHRAEIDGISGATRTAESFAAAVADALRKAQ